jgi:hypothetical protein
MFIDGGVSYVFLVNQLLKPTATQQKKEIKK